MCERGESVVMTLQGKPTAIDGCIAPVVEALNAAGLETIASCCGHGHRPGNIALRDGRELMILPDYETGRRVDRLFPKDINGEAWTEGANDCGMDYSLRVEQAARRIVGGSEHWTARGFERVSGGLIVRGCEVESIGPKGGREPDYSLPLVKVFVSEVEVGRER